MNFQFNRIQPFVIILLAGFAGACFYNFPSYDDFDYALMFLNKGYWEFQFTHYLTWGGRYTSNALVSAIIAFDSTWNYYSYWSLLILASTFFSFYFLARMATDFYGTNLLAPFLIFTVSLAASFRSITQAFYWITGAMTYTSSIVAGAIGVGLIFRREKKPAPWIDVILLLLTIVIVGFNEMALLGWMELLSSYLVLKYLKTKKLDVPLLSLIVIGSACGLFALFAPGNFIRQEYFEKSGQVFRTVGNGVLHFFLFSVKLLGLPIVIAVVRWRRELIAFSDKVLEGIESRKAEWVVFAHWFLYIFTTSALAFWAMGRKPNDRSMNVIAFFYWLMLPFIVWLIARWWKKPPPQWATRTFAFVDRYWVILFLVSLLSTQNIRNLLHDYVFSFRSYRQEIVERGNVLRNGRGQDVVLEQFQTRPRTTFYSDFGDRDPANLKMMFGLRSLTLKPREPKKE
jgi:hypothetical protein